MAGFLKFFWTPMRQRDEVKGIKVFNDQKIKKYLVAEADLKKNTKQK